MPLFRCSRCQCAENTALGDYWVKAGSGQPVLCSECSPLIGKWHDRFPRELAVPSNGWRDDPQRPQFIERAPAAALGT